jgi:3-oxoacyl-(acyl-carrier-protein) synthase
MQPWPIAIAAAGCASPLGFGWRGIARMLLDGARGIRPAAALQPTHPDVVGGEVPPIPADRDVGDKRLHRLMARGARLGAVAIRAALRDAALDDAARDATGMFLGVGASGSAPDEIDAVLRASIDDSGRYSDRGMGERGLKVFHPLRTFVLMPNFTVCHPAIVERVRGPSAAIFSRGAGTVTALIEAAHAIAGGDCPVAIAGGSDTALDCLTWSELVRDGHVGRGLIPGEAAAAFVLSSTTRDPLAWITGAAVAPIDGDVWSTIARTIAAAGGLGDLAVLAAWGPIADAARPLLGDRVLDLHAAVGDSLAATPSLAWCVALDHLVSNPSSSTLVLTAGPDHHLTAVRLSGVAVNVHSGVHLSEVAVRVHSEGVAKSRPGHDSSEAIHSGARPKGGTLVRPRRAVITGVGAVSPFGVGFGALLDGLIEGRRGIKPISCFDASPLAARVAGQVPVDAIDDAWLVANLSAEWLPVARRWLAMRAMRDRKIGFAMVAAAEAIAHAGIDDVARVPLALACGLERGLVEDLAPVLGPNGVDWSAEARRGEPAVRNRAPVDLAARAVVEMLGLGGAVTVHASACAAGAIAVAHGAALIQRGADVVMCGAADTMLDPIAVGAMITLGTTSPRRDDLDACRPFDRRRDGLVLGEGAAIFVLESEAHADARGARPLATILGWGASQDGYRPSAPDPDGTVAARAMARAIELAGALPEYVNAHGTGTPLNDVAEIRALRRALGAHAERVTVSSMKGAVGHLMTAAGAIEIAGSLLAFEHDVLPATANHRDRDPDCNLDIVGETPRPARVATVMSNSFGFGGQNAAVVLGRPQ